MKILVADDSKTNLALISASLNKLGHEVIPAISGQQAIELFQVNRPDLIILDVMMEGIDGFECAKRIREIESNNKDWIPIIFLSASVDDDSIAKGIDAGGDDYLTKPFSEITLAAKIKAMQRISDMRLKLFDTTQQLYLLSSTDSLTGIYNRLQFDRSINEYIASADRHHHLLALLFIDLDSFKSINDSFGHHVGDLLLIEVSKRLKSCLRAYDFIARLGGDEFAIILNEIDNVEDAGYIAQKLIDVLGVDYNLEGHHIRNGASIGVAFYPDQATTKDSLILNADVAMYHAKSLGRNNYQFFSDELNEKYKKQISLEHDLKFALEKKEIVLQYQPIFKLPGKKLIGLEVIISWEHPQYGSISPNIFLPLAEDIGLMSEIGQWALRNACNQASQWPLDKIRDFRFAINISARQMLHENFFSELIDILSYAHISPQNLELELTETAVMAGGGSSFYAAINKLHDLGVRISIDNFGTGYSSLNRLKNLPLNTLKIEKTFVQDSINNPNGEIIVNCLIALGKNLGLNVIAEGIESQEQLDFLIHHRCPEGQGNFLSKPLNVKQMTALFKKSIVSKDNEVKDESLNDGT